VLESNRTGVVGLVVLALTFSGGVAVADPPTLNNVDEYKETAEHSWRLHVSLRDMSITSVPNMAATAFSREAFLNATAEVEVLPINTDNPTPPDQKITQRSISLWLQMGCQATMSSGTLTYSNTSSAGLSATAATSGGNSLSPSVGESPNPQYGQTLAPGTIVGKNLRNNAYPDQPDATGAKPPWVGPGWTNDKLTVSIQNWVRNVDNCAGPASFRFIGEAMMSTSRSNDNVNVFSDIVQV
jgi:hypothetical protein